MEASRNGPRPPCFAAHHLLSDTLHLDRRRACRSDEHVDRVLVTRQMLLEDEVVVRELRPPRLLVACHPACAQRAKPSPSLVEQGKRRVAEVLQVRSERHGEPFRRCELGKGLLVEAELDEVGVRSSHRDALRRQVDEPSARRATSMSMIGMTRSSS